MIAGAAAAGWVQACGRERETDSARAAGLGLEPRLNLYMWSDYLSPTTVPGFERETGVRVTLDTYESNEELLAKLQSGATGYDLIVPSSYLLRPLIGEGLLEPLDRARLPDWGNLAPAFLEQPSDPGNRYALPWQWGYSGIAYRTDKIAVPPDSWSVFMDPGLARRMTMMDDMREVIGSMLRLRGRSANSVDPRYLEQARADALRAKVNLKAYVSAPVKGQLIIGDVWLAQLWNGDAEQARSEQPAIAFVLPAEGSTMWTDFLAMPRAAPHPASAHAFMNYMLRPEVAANLSDFTGYGSSVAGAAPMQKHPVPFPSAEQLARLQVQEDLGAGADLWDRIWTEIKAG